MANKKQFLIGFLALIIGTGFYFVGRTEGSSYLQQTFAQADKLFHRAPNPFGRLAGSFPEFIHPFAFSLMAIGIISRTRKSRYWLCGIFFSMNVLFEIGQRYGGALGGVLPAWLGTLSLIETLNKYFLNGTFSPADLGAIALGSVAAFIVAEVTSTKEGRNEAVSKSSEAARSVRFDWFRCLLDHRHGRWR